MSEEQGPLPLRRALPALAASAVRVVVLLATRRIRQPVENVGREIGFADGTRSRVYRETVITGGAPTEPTLLVVGFRLRRVRSERAHRLFRLESELNTVLFAGFPGFVSKLWLRADEHGLYRGIYQWDGAALADSHARALWWALVVVSERQSIHYSVLGDSDRDEMLDNPSVGAGDEWWRPSS